MEKAIPRELFIDGTRIADDTECYVIAEIGHNHGGDISCCKEMFRAAKDCGANAVKLQKRDNKTLYTKEYYNSIYNSENAFGRTYGEHREALEFNWEQYKELKAFAEAIGITFFATAFDIPSLDFLVELGVPCIKIASGDLTSLSLINEAAHTEIPVIISTGGGTLPEVMQAYNALNGAHFALLQCTSGYPASMEEMDLSVIETFRATFPNIVIGLSDHSNGIALAPVAFALGARIIEKHFTLNRASKGTDHAFSLEPQGFRKMVRDLRRTKKAMGDGRKKRYPSENHFLAKQEKKLIDGEWKVDGKPKFADAIMGSWTRVSRGRARANAAPS